MVFDPFQLSVLARVRGVFVTLEGIDGSGKTTTAIELAQRLEGRGVRTVQLREPTEKTDASREIRRILRTASQIDEKTSADLKDLFLIDRLWDIEHQIKPALTQNKCVLLDRYYLSTAAYQSDDAGAVEKIMLDYLANSQILVPDQILFLDVPVEIALKRLAGRSQLDAFENEARLSRVQKNYRLALQIFDKKWAGRITQTSNVDYDAMASKIYEFCQA